MTAPLIQHDAAAFAFDWAGRSWDCHPSVPDRLLIRLVRGVTPLRSTARSRRQAGRTARQVMMSAVVEREAFERLLPPDGLLPPVLAETVMPALLDHYGQTTAAELNRYAAVRRGRTIVRA
jgi:hypothetical protein